MLDEERYDRIWQSTGEELRREASEQSFTELLRNVHDRMGNVRSAERQGWGVNYVNGVTRVSLTYATEYERGRAEEGFVWILPDGERPPELAGYQVNTSGSERPADEERSGGEESR